MKITIYIVSHNYGHYLDQAIQSVLKQTITDWELLIIDDGSSDNTGEVSGRYKSDPRIQVIRTEGIGLPSVCNLALHKAKGEYIIRLDGDDIFDDNILLVLANVLDKNTNIDIVSPDYYLIDEFGNVNSLEQRRKFFEYDQALDSPVNGACTMFRVSALLDIGGYRVDLGAQDGFDIWTRLARSDNIFNVNLPLFYYRRHHSNLTNNYSRIVYARRNIKRDRAKVLGESPSKIMAVIPCRRNYDFRKSIWSVCVGLKSLLEHAIDECMSSDWISEIIVTGDDPEIESCISKYRTAAKTVRFFPRDTQETVPSVPLGSTFLKIAKTFDPNFEGVLVVRHILSPFVDFDTIDEGVSTLIASGLDTVIGVVKNTSEVYVRSRFGIRPLSDDSLINNSFSNVYLDSHSMIVFRSSCLKLGGILGPRTACLEVPKNAAFFIGDEFDLDYAQFRHLKSGEV